MLDYCVAVGFESAKKVFGVESKSFRFDTINTLRLIQNIFPVCLWIIKNIYIHSYLNK